jgi:outer membrane protein assembly factor BamD (BamD/ComL family)
MSKLEIIFKIIICILSSGALYQDVVQQIQQHRFIFKWGTLLAAATLIYIVSDAYIHVTEGDGEYLPLEKIFNTQDEEGRFWETVKDNQYQLEDCKSYAEKYPEGRFKNKAEKCVAKHIDDKEIINFEHAKSLNTIIAFQKYIRESKNSKFVVEAEKRILTLEEQQRQQEFDWNQTLKTLEGCQSYLEQYPLGKFSEEARICVNQRKTENDFEFFRKAGETNTISAYQEYINNCGKNTCENRVRAEQNIAKLIDQEETANWNAMASTLAIEQCQSHLDKYPHGRYSEQAIACVKKRKSDNDNESYRKAVKANTIASLTKYINTCIENTCENKSRADQNIIQLIEQQEIADWNNIATTLSFEECKSHLEKYPHGKYSAQAETCISERRKQYCAKNEEDSQAAGDEAARNYALGTGAVTAGGCSALLLLGIFDLGASAATCYLAAGGTTAIAAASAKQEAYNAIRDPTCI